MRTATTAARFRVEAAGFSAEHGFRIRRVLTDNARASTESVLFTETARNRAAGAALRHVPRT